jgi:hypothetical protein
MGRCDNLILHCLDYRIQQVLNEWIRANGLQGNIDVVSIAGGCRNANLALQNIAVGLEKHGVCRVFLTQHDDCAAYGGHPAFSSPAAEREFLGAEMRELGKRIRQKYPQTTVTPLFIQEEGAGWKIVEA